MDFTTPYCRLLPEVTAQAILDRAVFEGGCAESSDASAATLEADVLKLYYDDFIAQWDGFLRDIRLTPIDDLNVARVNLKDLSSDDSALKRLLVEVVAETNLTRVEETGGGNSAATGGLLKLAQSKLGKVGKLAKKGAKIVGTGGGTAAGLPGAPVAAHFAPDPGRHRRG